MMLLSVGKLETIFVNCLDSVTSCRCSCSHYSIPYLSIYRTEINNLEESLTLC